MYMEHLCPYNYVVQPFQTRTFDMALSFFSKHNVEVFAFLHNPLPWLDRLACSLSAQARPSINYDDHMAICMHNVQINLSPIYI